MLNPEPAEMLYLVIGFLVESLNPCLTERRIFSFFRASDKNVFIPTLPESCKVALLSLSLSHSRLTALSLGSDIYFPPYSPWVLFTTDLRCPSFLGLPFITFF